MTVSLIAEDGALRTRLDEADWAAVVADAGQPPLPEWARPREGAPGPPPDVDPAVREALRLRGTGVVSVEVASTSDGLGVLAELVTDLGGVLGIVRRLAVGPGGGPEAAQVLPGVELGVTAVDRLADEVVRLLPPAPGTGTLTEVEVPEEYTVALGRALRTGDTQTVDTVCRDLGWAAPPAVLLALVRDLRGSAVVSVRGAVSGSAVAEWLLTGSGWVELVRTNRAGVRHVPREAADVRRTVVDALAAAADAALSATTAGGSRG